LSIFERILQQAAIEEEKKRRESAANRWWERPEARAAFAAAHAEAVERSRGCVLLRGEDGERACWDVEQMAFARLMQPMSAPHADLDATVMARAVDVHGTVVIAEVWREMRREMAAKPSARPAVKPSTRAAYASRMAARVKPRTVPMWAAGHYGL
jgi:hypothetical protein